MGVGRGSGSRTGSGRWSGSGSGSGGGSGSARRIAGPGQVTKAVDGKDSILRTKYGMHSIQFVHSLRSMLILLATA